MSCIAFCLLFEPETCGGSRYVYYGNWMVWFDFYEFLMICEYSGEFYDVWKKIGEKGILVIFGIFLRFSCSSGISDPEMMAEVEFDEWFRK